MPTYDYRCLKCSSIQEEFHSISEKIVIKCNVCNSLCEKIISTVGFIMKGEGCTTYNDKIKKSMLKKNSNMRAKMKDREFAGDSVKNIGDLKKKYDNF